MDPHTSRKGSGWVGLKFWGRPLSPKKSNSFHTSIWHVPKYTELLAPCLPSNVHEKTQLYRSATCQNFLKPCAEVAPLATAPSCDENLLNQVSCHDICDGSTRTCEAQKSVIRKVSSITNVQTTVSINHHEWIHHQSEDWCLNCQRNKLIGWPRTDLARNPSFCSFETIQKNQQYMEW